MAKEQINNRVLNALNIVFDTHKCLTKTAFAQRLGIKPSTFSEILKGRMNASTDLMALLTSDYGVSATWLLVGTGEMFVGTEQELHNSSENHMVDKLLDMLSKKDAIIRQQAEEIGKLRAEISQQKDRLEKTAGAVHIGHTADAG